ncbi:MAG: tripartite tricarboxylate transporter permease, partial [Beijerinckiaceae bacterium]
YLAGFIFALVLSGIYTINSSMFDIGLMLVGGLIGYLMKLSGFPFLPAVLGAVLGPMIEGNYRRSLLLSDGDHMIFWEDLICRGLIIAALVFVVISLARELRAPQPKAG